MFRADEVKEFAISTLQSCTASQSPAEMASSRSVIYRAISRSLRTLPSVILSRISATTLS